MIHVIASITIRQGYMSEFIKIFKSNVPNVLKEPGCLEYIPTVDLPSDLKVQHVNENVVTVIEKWQTVEDLITHLSSPHMLAYREKVKDHVADVSLNILQEA
jgi:quinol monooxygenase YgiN